MAPHDRLPIIEETHESGLCNRRCFRKASIALQVRSAQRAQANTTGYFGGYIGKRQRAGQLEAKKCIDKLYTLRAKMAGTTRKQQERAVSGRMMTEVEMNGALRGAVEVFNLASNLRRGDVLFAECIRTFPSRTIDGYSWRHRLHIEA